MSDEEHKGQSEAAISGERRIGHRLRVECSAWISRESINLTGTVTNLSMGGLFIRTSLAISTGCQVDVRIQLDGGGIALARGRVVWVNRASKEGQVSGLGVRFDEIQEGRELLERLTKEQQAYRVDCERDL